MENAEAGQKVKQACLDKLYTWSKQLGQEDSHLACLIWDTALYLEKEVVVEDVLANG